MQPSALHSFVYVIIRSSGAIYKQCALCANLCSGPVAHSLEHLVALVVWWWKKRAMTKQTDGTGHPSSDPLIADCNICLKSATSGTLDTISPSSPPTSSSPPYNLMPHSGEVQVVEVITDWDLRDRLRWLRRTARGGNLAATGDGAAVSPPGLACAPAFRQGVRHAGERDRSKLARRMARRWYPRFQISSILPRPPHRRPPLLGRGSPPSPITASELRQPASLACSAVHCPGRRRERERERGKKRGVRMKKKEK